MNLRDSGCDIVVGIPTGDPSRRRARSDMVRPVTTVGKACSEADIIIMAFPDHLHGQVFACEVAPNLKPNAAVVFLHGFSIHFKTIVPPDENDIILLAPLGPGVAVREKFLDRDSVGFFYAVHRDASGQAKQVLNFLIRNMRAERRSLIETSFAEEAVGDLFGEQAVLCGGLASLIKAGFDTLTEHGLDPDKAYLEVVYQLDLIINLIKEHGIAGMFERISVAAQYGSLRAGPKIIDSTVKATMKEILREIENGGFALKLNGLSPDKLERLSDDLKKLSSPDLEKAAARFSPKRRRNHR